MCDFFVYFFLFKGVFRDTGKSYIYYFSKCILPTLLVNVLTRYYYNFIYILRPVTAERFLYLNTSLFTKEYLLRFTHIQLYENLFQTAIVKYVMIWYKSTLFSYLNITNYTNWFWYIFMSNYLVLVDWRLCRFESKYIYARCFYYLMFFLI